MRVVIYWLGAVAFGSAFCVPAPKIVHVEAMRALNQIASTASQEQLIPGPLCERLPFGASDLLTLLALFDVSTGYGEILIASPVLSAMVSLVFVLA